MAFPDVRLRRLRRTSALRALVRETRLSPRDLIYPMFFHAGLQEPRAIATMPGIHQWPLREAPRLAKEIETRGVGGVILFGLPERKDEEGRTGLDPQGPVPRAVAAMKDAAPSLVVITDVCVDEYTSHGHCGVLRPGRERDASGAQVQEVDNDRTLEILAEMAVLHARAGADIVAPSDMMDGRVARLRTELDGAGLSDTPIMSYAVKYASAFYGPFRDAADCAPQFGDRAGYQMDPANAREGLREAALDEAEGADILMVKPALPYLDMLTRLRATTSLPLAAYNVSGEYSMLHAAAERGMLDLTRSMMEVLTSIRRAGADMILSYHALAAAELLNG
jgi:porphobilinogen synthase